jgi:glutamyl-tRNA(Gln) amidotransferase subunit D
MPRVKKTSKASGRANPGDLVRVAADGETYEGVLLPAAVNDTKFVTIKLKSGYNIGIAAGNVSKTEVLQSGASGFLGDKKPSAPKVTKPYVSLLSCGGTIASRIDYRTGAVLSFVSPEELLESLPKIPGISVKPRPLFSISSEDMAPAHWTKIACGVADELSGGAEGVVVTHGTDTMHYTSAALSFMLQGLPAPVVLTGSQRSSDRGSSDAQDNVRAALTAAKADLSGVFVCMHENLNDDACALHFGTKVRKMHTSRRDAFRSINSLPAARIYPATEKFEKISPLARPRGSGKLSLDVKMNTNVALLYAYPGIRPEAISALSRYDGVVLAGTGLGHLPINTGGDRLSVSVLPAVKKLVASDIPVVLTSQTIYGRIDMDVYSPGRELEGAGVIGNLCDMTPETAYVKLMWVLGHEKKMAKVKELMEKNLAGEISKRSEITDY